MKRLIGLLAFLGLPLLAQVPGSIGVNSPAKVAATGYASDLVGASPQGRVVYQQSTWANLNDFTADSANVTAGVANGKITLSGSSSSLSGWLALNPSEASDENVDFEVVVVVNTLGSGFSVGKISQNTTYGNVGNSLVAWMDTSDTPNKLQFLAGNGSNFSSYGYQFQLGTNIAAGDLVRITYSQRGTRVTEVIDDYTSGTHYANETTLQLPPPYTPASPNTSKLAFWVQGGSYTIQSMRVASRQAQHPDVAVVGDSKSWGYGATVQAQRWPALIRSLGSVAVYAGQGDGTTEVLADVPYICSTGPRYALLNIGRNDIANSIPTATWQGNYAAIVSGLKACGITVVHLLPIPENNSQGLQSSLKTYIQSTFPNDGMIDVSGNFSAAADTCSDTTHPNDAGHAIIAADVIASGLIPKSPIPSAYEPSASAVQYPPTAIQTGVTTATAAQANYLKCDANCTPSLTGNQTVVFITSNNVTVTLPQPPLNLSSQSSVGPTYTISIECFQDVTGCAVVAPSGGSIVGASGGYPLSSLQAVTLSSYAVSGIGYNWIITGSH